MFASRLISSRRHRSIARSRSVRNNSKSTTAFSRSINRGCWCIRHPAENDLIELPTGQRCEVYWLRIRWAKASLAPITLPIAVDVSLERSGLCDGRQRYADCRARGAEWRRGTGRIADHALRARGTHRLGAGPLSEWFVQLANAGFEVVLETRHGCVAS
jgi:hypothetical protein